MKSLLCVLFILSLPRGFSSQEVESQDGVSTNDVAVSEDSKKSEQITGGEEVAPHAYPFQVAIKSHFVDGEMYCGGSLISTSRVLTAAHCLMHNGREPIYAEVFLGAHDFPTSDSKCLVLNSTSFIRHPSYVDSPSSENDIALIDLPKSVTLNEHIGIVTLARHEPESYGKLATALGWGITSPYTFPATAKQTAVLRKITNPILTHEECASIAKKLGLKKDFKPSQICIIYSTDNNGACGELGGPLLVNKVQVGVRSFLANASGTLCQPGYPLVFTKVSHYGEWLEPNLYAGGSSFFGNVHCPIIISIILCIVHVSKCM